MSLSVLWGYSDGKHALAGLCRVAVRKSVSMSRAGCQEKSYAILRWISGHVVT